MAKKSTFVIIDGNALIHRAFHALPLTLTTRDGKPINAVYGFTSVLLKVLKELHPEYVAVAFDPPGKVFRHKDFADYKATRVKQPQELYDQFPRVKKIVESFNIPQFEVPGYEADDVIGTLTATKAPVQKVIVTGDMDTLQLVDADTSVTTLKKGIGETFTFTPKTVEERFGLKPNQMIDYKALRGDPSDNIPGVNGIGEKTASELLQKFGTVDKLYAALKSAKGPLRSEASGSASGGKGKLAGVSDSVQEKLRRGEKDAKLSKKLATIVRDVPLEFSLAATSRKHYDRARVAELFRTLQFTSLLARLPENEATEEKSEAPAVRSGATYIAITDEAHFKEFFAGLQKAKSFAVDSETTGLDHFTSKLLGLSFSWEAGKAYFLDTRIKGAAAWLKKIAAVLQDPAKPKETHNGKFDWRMLIEQGIDLSPLAFDTRIAAYLLNPGQRTYTLEHLAFTEFGYEMQHLEELIGPRGKKQMPVEMIPLPKLAWYSAEDADMTHRLAERFLPELKKRNLLKLFQEIEMPLITVLGRMERAGIEIDRAFLGAMAKKVGSDLATLEQKIFKAAGTTFNIGSPIQLKEVLFEKLQIATKGVGKTKTGLSTAADQLEKLKDAHPIIPFLSEWRELSKLKSTYLDALPQLVHPKTGRLHTSFNQTIAATGRLSSSDPNLQNIPVRTELGREIRKAFIARRGFRLISVDYSQIELRVVAHLAGDQTMIDTFRRNEDIHRRTAAEINGVSLDKVTKEQRYAAKEVNFGVLYGMGSVGLSQRTGISRDEARAFIDKYFVVFRAVAQFLEEVKAQAVSQGYVETLFGRRRYLPEIRSGNPMLRAAAERMAINMPVQGTAADIMKMAMIVIDKKLGEVSKESRMLLQVHDELVFEVPEKDVQKVAKFVQSEMKHIHPLKVPIEVEVKVGKNWGVMEPLSP